MQLPSLEDSKDRIPIKAGKYPIPGLWITTIDIKYAFGQVKLAKITAKHCVVAIVGEKKLDTIVSNVGIMGWQKCQ